MSAGSLGSAQAEILIDISKALQSLTQFGSAMREAGKMGDGAFDGVANDLEKASDAVDTAANSMADAGAKIGQVGPAMEHASDSAREADTSMTNAGDAAEDLGNKTAAAAPKAKTLAETGRQIAQEWDAAGATMVTVGTAITGAVGAGIWTAGNFEQAMSGVEASLMDVNDGAGVTTEQFAALSDEALRIGAETSMGANDAAAAMEMMAKSGVSLESILNGGAQAAVNIAEATGEALPQAADTMSAMLNLFAGTGVTAGEMADTIVNGMNASQATMSEFQTGIARMAPAILATGMNVQEAAGMIAYFNAQGFSAASTGTALATVYTRLVNPSGEAATAIEELGIAAFDSQQKFIGYPALFDQVREATADMGDQQRDMYLATIFGAEGLDVMTMAALNGGDALRDVTEDMGNVGTAARASEIRMNNFKGTMEELFGTIESISIVLGSKLTPALDFFARTATTLLGVVLKLPDGLQTLIAVLTAFVGVTLLAGGTAVLALPRILMMADSFRALSLVLNTKAIPAMRAFAVAQKAMLASNPLLLAGILLVTGAILAYQTNFLGFGDAVRRVGAYIGDVISTFRGFYEALRAPNEMGVGGFDRITAAVRAMAQVVEHFTGLNLLKQFLAIGKAASRITNAFKKIGSGITGAFGALIRGDLVGAIRNFRKALAGIGDLASAPAKFVGEFLRSLETGFKPLDRFIHNIGDVWRAFGRLIQEIFQGDIRGAFDALMNLGRNLAEMVLTGVNALVAGLRTIDWGGLFSGLWDAAKSLGSWTLDVGIPKLGGKILEIAGNFWGWLKNKILGGNGAPDGAYLGDANGNPIGGQMSVTDWILDVAIPAVGGAIKNAFKGVWEWLKEQVPDITDLAGEIGEWILSVDIPTVGGDIVDAFTSVWAWIKSGVLWLGAILGVDGASETPLELEVPGPKINIGIPEIGGDIVDAFTGMFEAAKSVAKWLTPPYTETVNLDIDIDGTFEALDTLLSGFEGAIRTALGWVGGAGEWVYNAAVTVVTTVLGDENNDGPTTDPYGNEFEPAVAAPEAGKVFDPIGAVKVPAPDLSAFNLAFDTDMPATIQTAADKITELVSGASVPSPDTADFDATAGELAPTLGTGMNDALGKADVFSVAIGTVIGTNLGAMLQNATGMMNGFVRVITFGMNDALGKAATFSSAIVTAVGNILGGLHDVGRNATMALASGMLSAITAVQSAAYAVAYSAKSAVEKAFEVSSPSRVFMRIGAYLDQGLALGMTGNLGVVQRAAADVANAAMIGVDLRGGDGLNSALTGSRQMQVIQNVWQVMPEELAKLMEDARNGAGFANGLTRELGLRL